MFGRKRSPSDERRSSEQDIFNIMFAEVEFWLDSRPEWTYICDGMSMVGTYIRVTIVRRVLFLDIPTTNKRAAVRRVRRWHAKEGGIA